MGQKYAEPFKGGPQYAPLPPTLRQYNLSFPLVSRYPYSASPNVQRYALGGYSFQQNGASETKPNYLHFVEAYKPVPVKKPYLFAQKNYALMEKAALPLKEHEFDLVGLIRNEFETLMLRQKKKLLTVTNDN